MKPVDAALADARAAVMSQFPDETEWVAPALYLSRKDATVLFHPGRGAVQDVYQLSEGRYRRRLRETLNRFWPKPERYFPQLLQWLPRDEPLTSYLHAAEFLGQPHSASELNQRFQRLLLLGSAGIGQDHGPLPAVLGGGPAGSLLRGEVAAPGLRVAAGSGLRGPISSPC